MSVDPRTDEELIAAIEAGDDAAFEALYRRYREWVVGVAYRFTQDRELALDVLQQTFLHLLERFPGFVLRARLTTFLYPVARHRALAALRKVGRLRTDEDPPPRAAPAEEESLDRREALARALEGLSEAHREVLLLRFVDGLALDEVAAATEVPLGTVKSRLHHALRALRADPGLRAAFEPEFD